MDNTSLNKARIIYGVSSWGTAAYLLFSVLATAHCKLPIAFVSGFRFAAGMLLTVAIAVATPGDVSLASKARRTQLQRSALLFVVTVALIAASLALRNVAMLNAYTFSLFPIAILRARFAHGEQIAPVGWLAVAVCVAGIAMLTVASGSGKHPLVGLGLVLVAIYCQVLMLELSAIVKKAGDSSLCTLFWSGLVGFGVTLLLALLGFMGVDLGMASLEAPELDAYSTSMLAGVTFMAVLPQWGYAKASETISAADLASAGLTQIVPALLVQVYLDHGRWPNAWALSGMVFLLASAWLAIKGQKPVKAASH